MTGIGATLERIKRVAQTIELDAKSPWNKERARELQNLIDVVKREIERDRAADRAGDY
jgi:hypothetical protein